MDSFSNFVDIHRIEKGIAEKTAERHLGRHPKTRPCAGARGLSLKQRSLYRGSYNFWGVFILLILLLQWTTYGT